MKFIFEIKTKPVTQAVTYCFSYKSHIKKKLHPHRSIPFLSLPSTWHKMCTDGILLPDHSTTSFVWDQSANLVSAANLLCECPHSLLTALAATHPNQDT